MAAPLAHPPAEGLAALFGRFLAIGCQAWGGPVAQIALLRRLAVEEWRWVAPERFNRLLAVYQALPGPEAHELCVHVGMMRHGRLGGLLAGLGFMAPGLLLILLLAALYRSLPLSHPAVQAALAQAQLVVIALILLAVWRIGRHAVTDRWALVVALLAFLAGLLLSPLMPATSGQQELWLGAYFLTGLKGGLLTFGGAYTAVPVVRADLVGPGRLDDGTFLDGLALTNLLPAPLVLFATFAAVQLGGLGAALALTLGMFLPAFGFGLLFFDRLEGVLDNVRLHRLLDLVAAAAVGLMAATALGLLRRHVDTGAEIGMLLAALSLLLALKSRWAVPGILAAAALAGLVGATI